LQGLGLEGPACPDALGASWPDGGTSRSKNSGWRSQKQRDGQAESSADAKHRYRGLSLNKEALAPFWRGDGSERIA
jgi:hypothetical protein